MLGQTHLLVCSPLQDSNEFIYNPHCWWEKLQA